MNLRVTVDSTASTSRKVTQSSKFGQIITLQLENVSNRAKLSEILRTIVTDYKTITGIIRVADYNQKLLDSVVFLQFYDNKEAECLLATGSLFLFGQLVRISNPYLVQGRVPFSFTYNVGEEDPRNGIPVPMAVFNFNDKAESNTTIHLIKVLEAFEFHTTITSFRFAFNHKRHIIRKFGTITFLNRRDALTAQVNEYNIMGNKLEIKIPQSFPVLLHNSLAGLLLNGQGEFSSNIRDNNWYHANLADDLLPQHPIPKTLEVQTSPEVANIPLPPEPVNPIVPSNSRQLLDEAFAIANIGEEIGRLNSDFFIVTPPPSPVLSLGGNEDFDELIKEVPTSKKRKLN